MGARRLFDELLSPTPPIQHEVAVFFAGIKLLIVITITLDSLVVSSGIH